VTYHERRVGRSVDRKQTSVSSGTDEHLRVADDVEGVERAGAHPRRLFGVASSGLQEQEAAYSNRGMETLVEQTVTVLTF
jgi:hypothetical protein